LELRKIAFNSHSIIDRRE